MTRIYHAVCLAALVGCGADGRQGFESGRYTGVLIGNPPVLDDGASGPGDAAEAGDAEAGGDVALADVVSADSGDAVAPDAADGSDGAVPLCANGVTCPTATCVTSAGVFSAMCGDFGSPTYVSPVAYPEILWDITPDASARNGTCDAYAGGPQALMCPTGATCRVRFVWYPVGVYPAQPSPFYQAEYFGICK